MKKVLTISILTISALLLVVVAFDFMGFSLYERDNWKKISDKPVKGKYYYDFDEVVYYKTTKGFNDLFAIDDKKIKTLKDSITFQVMGGFKEAIPYEIVVPYLDSIGYEKKVLPVSMHKTINEIFREKSTERTEWAACAPIYRDIYVFKKKGKFSGMAKLCYECGLTHFVGTNAKTEDFGMEGEFGELNELVK